METLFADYLDRLETLHRHLDQALDGLSVAGLDWTPGPGMNSLAVIVTHLTGAERFWIGDVAGRRPSGRVREEEFHVQGLNSETLRAGMAKNLALAREVLAELSLAGLGQERNVAGEERPRTAGWALLHALEHTGLHLGHVQLTRQLLEDHLASRH